jgi:uncharacterized protein YjiS (DUF1127 family)
LEVWIVSNRHRAGGKWRLNALLGGLARRVHDRLIDPIRRHARRHAGERELARLDDRVLRDIGLTRPQIRAAACGVIALGQHRLAESGRALPSGAGNVHLLRGAITLRGDGATPAYLGRAARG